MNVGYLPCEPGLGCEALAYTWVAATVAVYWIIPAMVIGMAAWALFHYLNRR